MNRDVLPRHGELGAADECDSRLTSGLLRFAHAAHDVVIGQGEHVDAAFRRAGDDRRRRKEAVGMGGVAVEVVAEH